jgi:hypothetical protein
VTGGWKKLHNEELHNLYTSPSIIKTIALKTDRVCITDGGEGEFMKDIGGKAIRKESSRRNKM